MLKVTDTLIVDLDDCLCKLTDERRRYGDAKEWHLFHSLLHTDTVQMGVRSLMCIWELCGGGIAISTARPSQYVVETMKWLVDNSVPYHHLFMRPALDLRSSGELKKWILDNITGMGFSVLLAMDDKESVCKMYEENGIPAIKVKKWI